MVQITHHQVQYNQITLEFLQTQLDMVLEMLEEILLLLEQADQAQVTEEVEELEQLPRKQLQDKDLMAEVELI